MRGASTDARLRARWARAKATAVRSAVSAHPSAIEGPVLRMTGKARAASSAPDPVPSCRSAGTRYRVNSRPCTRQPRTPVVGRRGSSRNPGASACGASIRKAR